MNESLQKTVLVNGLTVLTEKMPDVRSATIGIWIKTGSRHEPNDLNGIHHFVEHAVFKGTPRRSALDIAIETDRLGGHFDAYTSHETTAFLMKVVDDKTASAFDLLADMIANPLFDDKEMRREQKVIIEEMKMVEDTPEEFLSELFNREFFGENPLGLPIEGTARTVKTFDRQQCANFHQQFFHPSNIIIAAAGNIEHNRITDLASKFFNDFKDQRPKTKDQRPTLSNPIFIKKKRDLEQAQLVIAAPFTQSDSPQRYAANLLTNILGGGTSSRLWQAVREKRGLAYSVGASAIAFADCGMFTIYAATSPKQLETVVDLSIAELRKIVREGVTSDELELVKDQATASILLGLESSSARVGTLVRQEIVHQKRIAVDETLANIRRVTVDDVRQLAQEFFQTEKIALGALGDLSGLKIDRARLQIS